MGENITQRTVRLLKEFNRQDKELCDYIGVAQSTFTNWKNRNTEPKSKYIPAIAEFFNVSVDYLLNGEEKAPAPTGEAIRLNVLGSVPAGVPLEAIEDIVDWEEIPQEWTRGGKEYFSLRVKGDSMSPEYLDGDNIILQKTPDCESGDDCVVYVNGYDATFKRVIKKIDHVILQPINPSYEPIMCEYGNGDNIKIAGVVVELRRNKKK